MVEGLSNSNNIPNFLKLKGQKKTINLNNLEGLKRTEQNKSWFDKVDLDHNGIIDNQEAIVAKNSLATTANGNSILSQKEAAKQGLDFNALTSLADQQAKLEQNEAYSEKNGDVTTTVTKEGTTYTYENGDTKTVKNDGTIITTYNEDGTTMTKNPDGTAEVVTGNGEVTKYQNGIKTSYTDAEGNVTTFSPDGNKATTKNKDGQTLKTIELKDEQEIKTEYEYQDGKTIAREYSGINEDAELKSITVSTQENGHTKDIKYSSEDNMKSNLPSEEITDAQNPVTKTITTYTYDDKGNVKLETKNSAGEVTETKYKDKDGNEIESNQFDAPKEHTVEKGENITTIVKNALKEQGFNDEALEKNPDILKNAKAEFLEANKDLVKTYNGSKAEWKGNKYFLIGDKVTIPKFTINADTSKEVEKTPTGTKTATETESEQDAQLQKIQATLGDGYKVVYNQDGEIEVRDKDGNIAESATAKARDSITSDDNDAKKMIDEADKNNNKTLNIDEYRNYLRNMISDSGIDVNGANKDKIDEIINNSFTSVDTINADGELTQKEIAKNMKNTFAAIEAQLEENNIFE